MDTSTPRLSEYARKFVYPAGIVKTVWPRVEAKGAELGLRFDWWQSQAGTVCLGYNADGRYVATVGGIGMSIPRQVGKTYFVLAMLVLLCILFPGLQVVWTAHHLRTSTKTFATLQGICRRKKVMPHIAKNDHGRDAIRTANGEQQVKFTNGSMIMFGARAMGFGRGFDEIDIEVFDEAQILETKALEDMVAAAAQARHEHGALLFFMGTPPRPTDPSEEFTERRAEAWAGEAEDAIWLEIGADPRSDPDDRSQWPLMNPSFPKRTPLESLLRLRKNLKNDDSWNREGRGVWDEDAKPWVIPRALWGELADGSPEPPRPVADVAFAVDSTPDNSRTAISVAGERPDGGLQVQVVECGDGQEWAVPRLVELHRAWTTCAVVVDPTSTAGALIGDLEAAGLPVVQMTAKEVVQACSQFYNAATERRLRHLNQPELTGALSGATKRELEAAWAWNRRDRSVDITPLVSATNALWGWTTRHGSGELQIF